MISEYIILPCGHEADLLYSFKDECEVVSQSTCKCKKKIIKDKKVLDEAFKILTKQGILNESNFRSTSKSTKSI